MFKSLKNLLWKKDKNETKPYMKKIELEKKSNPYCLPLVVEANKRK